MRTGLPLSALAPMQDVTTLPFMRTISSCGAPDYFFTEYFRVHAHSRLESHILESITENETGRPIFAQLIGEDLDQMERTALALQQYPVAGIDLNMGCPAPKVYKKNVGGGLLRDPDKIDALLGRLRSVCRGLFTVKMRIGFESPEHFEAILDCINRHAVDLLSVHGRTVKEMYRGAVHYDFIRSAVQRSRCPVLANGNVTSAASAAAVIEYTGAAGVMIGRSAIRNPWIFRQLRETFEGDPVYQPRLADVRSYVDRLWENTRFVPSSEREDVSMEARHVARMKKFLNFVAQGVDAEGAFLHRMRRARTRAELFRTCDAFLVAGNRGGLPFADEPFAGLVARPTREGDAKSLSECAAATW